MKTVRWWFVGSAPRRPLPLHDVDADFFDDNHQKWLHLVTAFFPVTISTLFPAESIEMLLHRANQSRTAPHTGMDM